MTGESQMLRHRLVMAALGGAMGMALWMLGRQWNNPAIAPALFLASISWAGTYATVALAMVGPVSVVRALCAATIPATIVAVLVSLAGLRHVTAMDLVEDPALLSVLLIFMLFSLPFLIVWLQDRAAVTRYENLFLAAWTMAVRYVAAWMFVVLFWLAAFLGDALLELVGIDLIETAFEEGWARSVVTGLVLGLGLAVVHEMREMISPFLILRLLRLLIVPVLAVVAVFLLALPVRGLTQLFGAYSAASILMAMATVGLLLISAALDQNDQEAVHTPLLCLATRLFALLLAVLTGLAALAVAVRVREYGWTPDRLLAALIALILLAYGISYGVVACAARGWMARIRRVNVWLALGVIVLTGLWMTPVLDVFRLSTNSQIDRFDAGESRIDQLPLWQMAHEWGRAGQDGLDRLAAMTGRADHANILTRIETARTGTNRFRFEQAMQDRVAPQQVQDLQKILPVRPLGSALPDGLLATAPSFRLQEWLDGCRRRLPDGRAGCVLILGQYSPAAAADAQGILLYREGDDNLRAKHLMLGAQDTLNAREVFDPVAQTWPTLPVSMLNKALDGAFRVGPSGDNALFIDRTVLVPGR
ncbi:DUF4153 domain-containing protein [Rhodobacteraceae bacterium F11138]|nr:DUF4153 domain-containing protein [Rhodobacteraceae bacterium F11138]